MPLFSAWPNATQHRPFALNGGKPLNKTDNVKLDRLALRARPEGSPLMEQTWERLLFMHWPIDPQILRPLIPARLEIDLFDEKAWIGVTPFFLSGLRPMAGPGIPGLTAFHELNVRTYVHCDGVPGVWFFSLYCSKKIPVMAARFMYSLNYVKARFKEDYDSSTIQYQMTKTGALPLRWKARWSPGVRLRDAEVDSLAFFLTERYCLYGSDGGKLIRGRIYHAPWELQDAELLEYKSNMVHAQNLPEPTSAPLLHYAERMHVEVWPPTTL